MQKNTNLCEDTISHQTKPRNSKDVSKWETNIN